MEIEQLRQDINDLLENVVEHSNAYSAKEHLSSLDARFILKKVNKVQEALVILNYLLEAEHQERGEVKLNQPTGEVAPVVPDENISEIVFVSEEPLLEKTVEEIPVVSEVEEVKVAEVESPKKENIEQPSIAKLSNGLTLNDRYLYANELFNKDMNAFNELVKAIDTCVSMDEAIALYSSMDWELDNEHVISFTNLVERRFS